MILSNTHSTQKSNNLKQKNKKVHPQIMKIMLRPNNLPKPVTQENIAITNTFSSFNAKNNKKVNDVIENAKANPNEKAKDLILVPPSTNKKKSFSMNFAQLNTGKPCKSCGGR
jgi:predicted Zn-ribbon and HTH transcriptional regulator